MSTHDDGFHPSKSDRTRSDRISSDPSILDAFGWSPDLAEAFEHHLQTHPHPVPRPARVISASREVYRVQTPSGERPARASGRLRAAGELPAIGDWVAVDGDDGEARIHAVLPRRTRLSRKVAGGRTEEQVVAANVDVVFLVMGLDGDFNLRRLERFAVMAWASGAEPVVLLTKADLADDVPRRLHQAGAAAPGMPVYAVSALAGEGLDAVRAHLAPGRTVALIGSSGVGKSTLVNRLCGEEVMLTSAVRVGDDRGRHTTTHRQLMRLPGGGLLIDNPGVREIQLWVDGDDGLGDAFDDVDALARACRFGDCTHSGEPGCAVAAAIEDGSLDPARMENRRTLEKELQWLDRRRDVAEQRRIGRENSKLYRSVQKAKRRRKGR